MWLYEQYAARTNADDLVLYLLKKDWVNGDDSKPAARQFTDEYHGNDSKDWSNAGVNGFCANPFLYIKEVMGFVFLIGHTCLGMI